MSGPVFLHSCIQDDADSMDKSMSKKYVCFKPWLVWGILKQNHAHTHVWLFTGCWAKKIRVRDVTRDIAIKPLASNLRGMGKPGQSVGGREMEPHGILLAAS